MSDNTPTNLSTYVPERALVIVAHPDDIEFGMAGTVARWTRAGAKVCYVICTDGDVGSEAPDMTRERLAAIRRAEQVEAARVVGAAEVVFLGHPDGLLVNSLELRRQLVYQIRRFRPDALLTLHPTLVFVGSGYLNHPDHRAAGQAALDAVFPAAGLRLVFPEMEAEGLQPHRTPYIYVNAWEAEADTFIDITDTIDLKIRALEAHVSQVGGRDIGEGVRQRAAERGQAHGMAYAESFRVIALGWAAKKESHDEAEAEAEKQPAVAQPSQGAD